MRRYFGPIVLMALALVAGLILAFWEGDLPFVGLFVFAVLGQIVATDWWIIRIAGARSRAGAKSRRIVGVLTLGAPSAILGVGIPTSLAIAGADLWQASVVVAIPSLLVWPFVVWALNKIQHPELYAQLHQTGDDVGRGHGR
jgi:hypothetical protein